MEISVKSGSSGNIQTVDKNLRSHTQSLTFNESIQSVQDGDAYNLNTGLISFTGDGTFIYFKNDEDKTYVLEAIAVGLGSAATHTDSAQITLVRNPTGGDLITDAAAVSMNKNRNFNSSKTLKTTTLVYKGKQGGTLTGGDETALFFQGKGGRLYVTVNFILKKGDSFGLKTLNKISSGTMPAYCALVGYFRDPENE